MAVELSADELAAYFALRRAGDRLQRAVTGQLRSYDLTEVQFSVLAHLDSFPSGIGMTDLAKALVVTKGGLTYQAKQLEARGLVARIANERDDRGVLLTLAPEGSALLARVLPAHISLVRELLIDRIDPAALGTIREALAQLG